MSDSLQAVGNVLSLTLCLSWGPQHFRSSNDVGWINHKIYYYSALPANFPFIFHVERWESIFCFLFKLVSCMYTVFFMIFIYKDYTKFRRKTQYWLNYMHVHVERDYWCGIGICKLLFFHACVFFVLFVSISGRLPPKAELLEGADIELTS